MSLCAYKNMLGKVGQGVHSYRFLGIAVVDVVLTVLFAVLFAWMFEKPFWLVLLVLFLVGIVVHRLFCVRTTVDRVLFPSG